MVVERWRCVCICFFPFGFSRRISFVWSRYDCREVGKGSPIIVGKCNYPSLEFMSGSSELCVVTRKGATVVKGNVRKAGGLGPRRLTGLLYGTKLAGGFISIQLFSYRLTP